MEREPAFDVERSEIEGAEIELVPKFVPSNLDAEDADRYETLRELHEPRNGAIVLTMAEPHFEIGGEVTLERAHEIHREAAHDLVNAFRDFNNALKEFGLTDQ